MQQKYNLLREEPEGYLRAIYALNQPNKIENVREIIGNHNLDPNRVLDLAIEFFVLNPSDLEYLELIKRINTNAVSHLFGFKFQNSSDDCLHLAHIVAMCIKHEILNLESIWGYLKPESLARTLSDYQASAQSIRRNMDIVVLHGDSSQHDNDIKLFNSPDTTNQKLALFTELIRINSWTKVKQVFDKFDQKILVTNYPPLVEALCDLIHWAIDPIYQVLPKPLFSTVKSPIFPSGSLQQANSVSQALEILENILPILGASIGTSTDAYIKACKILQHSEGKSRILHLLKNSLLPGLTLASSDVIQAL